MTKVLALALALLAAAACSTAPLVSPAPTSAPPTDPSPTTAPTQAPTAPPTPTPVPSPSAEPNANVAVVQIKQTGGMLPPWETLRWYPSVSLYGDGRLITQGPQVDIYPGPALPNLQVTQLTAAGIEQVLAWAREAGLEGPDRQLGPLILDSGVTLFTVVYADGTTHHTSVTDLSASEPGIGALRAFQDVMLSLRAWLAEEIATDDQPYVFDRLRLLSSPIAPEDIIDPQLATEMAWPLAQPLATLGESMSEPAEHRCAEISGADLAQLLPLLEQSNELTVWRSEDQLFRLRLHPLLPDEEACPL